MNDPLVREIIIQLIAFAVVFWVLKSTAWKPLLKLLDDRKEKIAKGFRDIESGKNELESLKKSYAARLTKIEEEARLKIQEAVTDGKRIAQELREKAREDANQTLIKAKEHIEMETAKAQVELRTKIAELSLAAASHVLRKEMNEERQKTLVREFLEEVAAEPAR